MYFVFESIRMTVNAWWVGTTRNSNSDVWKCSNFIGYPAYDDFAHLTKYVFHGIHFENIVYSVVNHARSIPRLVTFFSHRNLDIFYLKSKMWKNHTLFIIFFFNCFYLNHTLFEFLYDIVSSIHWKKCTNQINR